MHAGFEIVGRPIVIAGYGMAGDGEQQGGLVDFDSSPTKRAGFNCYEILRDDQPFPGLDRLTYEFDKGKAKDNVTNMA